jgi:hypothetical protein
MAIDIQNLLNKENDNPSDAGRLTASEWIQLVRAVQENQEAVKGSIKGIMYNENTLYNEIDKDGILKMIVGDGKGRNTKLNILKFPDPKKGNHYITPDDPCIVEFIVEDYKIVNGVEEAFNVPGKLRYYINEELVYTQENVYAYNTAYYTGPISFDFSKYKKLTTSSNGNILRIEYINQGISPVNEYFNVNVLDIKLQVSNIEKIYSTDNVQNIKYDITGYQKYLMYATIDDISILDGIECDADNDYYISGAESNIALLNSHGTHTLKLWAEVQIPNSEYRISTPKQEYTYIYGDKNNNSPVIICDIASGTEFEIYSNLTVNYYAYLTNANESKNINISILSNSGAKLFNTTQKITFIGDTYNSSHTFTLFPEVGFTDNDILGDVVLSLSIENSVPFEIPIKIKQSTIQLTHERNYLAYLSAMGRSNSETIDTLKVWESTSYDGRTKTTVDFDPTIEFTSAGSGWNTDSDGNTAMHLRRGNKLRVNCKPFIDNPVYPNGNYGTGNGLTISVEFATRNCLNANAKVIDCMNNGIGFYVTASTATLIGNDVTLETAFREDTRIRIDIVIDDKLRTYSGVTAIGKKGEFKPYSDQQSYAIMFVDGVYAGVSLISPTTTFKQSEPQVITFGSDDCDLDIYNIRVYRKTLSIKNIIDNYAYDTPDSKEKIAIAKRNLNILSENSEYPFMPNINVEPARMTNGADGGLKVAKPNLPIFYITMDKNDNNVLPNTKDDWSAKSFTQFVNPLVNTPLNEKTAQSSFEVENSVFKCQGTSSMNYPWPWRNLDWKAKSNFVMPTLSSSISAEKWYQYPYILSNSPVSISKITLKKDYASSEMCNNAITSDYFTEMALGIYDKYIGNSDSSLTKHDNNPGVLSPAMYRDVTTNSTTDLRLSLKALPCFCIQKLTETTDGSVSQSNSDAGTFAIGMMNLIPNKNEVKYLGFTNNKWEDKTSSLREQSWELTENTDDMYWVKELNYIHLNDSGEYVSDLDGVYEARTPKDSTLFTDTDFGVIDGNNVSEAQALELYDQQKDIIDFHNWAVSVDRSTATNKPFKEMNPYWQPEPWNINPATQEALYTTDSKEYRLAKFIAEAEQHLIIDQWLLYYIWREQFWMFDSGFKNLQVYTVGENPKYKGSGIMQWGCMVRDADTALGIQNIGKIVFPPHLEDIDYYTPNAETGKYDFHYNAAKNIHGYLELKALDPKGEPVLNGQFGSLWLNLRDAYPAQIAAMYRNLSSSNVTKFNTNEAIEKFRKHQENWSESLYNFGLRQYIGGEKFTANLDAACGDKKQSRAQWLERGFYYRASKYKALGADYLNMRGTLYETTIEEEQARGNMTRVKTYIPMYIGLGGETSSMIGANGSKNHLRIVDVDESGNYYKDIAIDKDGFYYAYSPDKNNYIFGSSKIVDFGDLARYIKVKNFQNLSLPKLRKFDLGHEPERDGITYYELITIEGSDGQKTKVKQPISNDLMTDKMISFNGCPQLELLDLTNHVQLGGIQIDKCLQLQELYLRGTNSLQSVVFPKTSTLRKLYLNDKLTSLDLTDLSNLTTLKIDGLTNCTQLVIKNSGNYISSKDVSYNLMTQVINNEGLNKLILEDIVWDFTTAPDNDTVKYLEKILELRKTFGKENVSLKGKIFGLKGLKGDLKVKLCDPTYGFGNIDMETNDLYITYKQNSISKVSLPSKIYIPNAGEFSMAEKLIITPADANTYNGSTWYISDNDFATIRTDGTLLRNDKPCEEGTPAATLTVVVSQMPDEDGVPRDDQEFNTNVYFYERLAKPGDIVFNDGTYSDELDSNKIPIGICFYVDPKDRTKRLMCALDNVKISGMTYENTLAWGLDGGHGGYQSANNGGNQFYYGSNQNIKIEGSSYNCYDIIDIPKLSEAGPISGGTGTVYFTDAYYRDLTENGAENDYFNKYGLDKYFGDIGWKSANKDIKVDKLSLPDGKTNLSISKGDNVPSGYYNTLAIISHRNKILDEYYNAETGNFARPAADSNYSELYWLGEYMKSADYADYSDWESSMSSTGRTFGSHLYYPAASACFAYEPSVSGLKDKFKKYNWFLPASGDVVRILYYCYQSWNGMNVMDEPTNSEIGSSYNNPANAFANALNLTKQDNNLMFSIAGLSGGSNGSNYSVWSSTQNSRGYAVCVESKTGTAKTARKSTESSIYVRPVCVF